MIATTQATVVLMELVTSQPVYGTVGVSFVDIAYALLLCLSLNLFFLLVQHFSAGTCHVVCWQKCFELFFAKLAHQIAGAGVAAQQW